MIAIEDAERIAVGWVREYSVNPHVAKIHRERALFFELDDLVYHHPTDALIVFERIAGLALSDWAFEGVSGGPIREFLLLYGNQYDADMDAIGRRASLFIALRALAVEGL
jgi:hypothetical protein